jgi:hypothetical protein
VSAAPNDGGSAFPCEQHETLDGSWNQTFDPGMSLRDWFAGKALAGLLADPRTGSPEQYARATYDIADAMLAARATGAA